MVTYAVSADSNANPYSVRAFQISRTAAAVGDTAMTSSRTFNQPFTYLRGGILYWPSWPTSTNPDREERHNLHTSYNLFERGGSSVVVEPAGVRVWTGPGRWARFRARCLEPTGLPD